nr:hypothetical protein GCM10020093_076590 [Planobispora longispora]
MALAVAFIVPGAGQEGRRIGTPDGGATATVLTDPAPARDLRTDPDSTPPERLIAALDRAVYAYYIWRHAKTPDGKSTLLIRTWYLYDDKTGGYEKTPWALLDVAPGGGTVAVLEELPPAGSG